MGRGASYWDVVDPIWEAISIYDGDDVFLEQYRSVTLKQQVLFATHWAQSEIRNGGLHQFFSNSTGVLAPEAVAGYRALGMPKCAGVVETAMKFFGDPYSRDRETRNAALSKYESQHPDDWDPFEQLTDDFFDVIDAESGGYEATATQYAFGDAV